MFDTATPARTLVQRQEALQKANKHRIARAAWKEDVKRGPLSDSRVRAAELLIEPPTEFETMKVLQVLLALPKIGRVKANTMLRVAGVSPSKTIVGLSERQRAALVSMMPRSAGRRGTVRP